MSKFNYEKNRELIEEHADIVCALREYAQAWEGMDVDPKHGKRVRITLEKYEKKLAKLHAAERAYFNPIKSRIEQMGVKL